MVELKSPHIGVNVIPGGNRTGYPLGDAWAIVAKGLPRTDYNQAGEQLLEIVGKHEGVEKLRTQMETHARALNLSCAA